MLAGELMNTGGITQRIINFCMELLRPSAAVWAK